MAKKLGKKARKFARKNLQSVHRKNRKHHSMIKRKRAPPKHSGGTIEENKRMGMTQSTEWIHENVVDGDVSNNFLDDLLDENNGELTDDISDSESFLPEDSECPYISENEIDNSCEERCDHSALLGENNGLPLEIAKQGEKLDRLIKKDPGFSEFLESQKEALELFRHEEISSDEEDEASSQDETEVSENPNLHGGKVLTSYTLDVWCWLVIEQPDGLALSSLLNGFRAACRYGVELDDISSQRVPNGELFSKLLMFVLSEADGVFRRLLNVSDSCSKENILKLGNSSKWEAVRPLLKSYLKSSLFLLSQVTDAQILVYALSRLRASIIFFAAFPSLSRRLIKISVQLWATGADNLSLSSFFVLKDIASHLPSDYFDACLASTYKAFISRCKFVEPKSLKHIEFLKNSTVELYSLDIPKSYLKVLVYLRQLAYVLKQALKTKKKEDLKKIYNWQYINAINLWVKFITCNIKDHDLRTPLCTMIEVIRGIVHLFPGQRYLPLRFKCVQMLNLLSLSSGIFIPVASFLFDCLEPRVSSNQKTTRRERLETSSLLKVPKNMLKSWEFEEECILSAIELLSAHFAQWSYHISFTELATIPLILMKRFHEKTTVESLRRPVKRFIDQVEQNSEFVRRKRDEVSFSPNDQASVDTFLQLEKSGPVAAFTQYYTGVLQNSRARSMVN